MKHCSPFLKLQIKFKLGLYCKAALWVIFGELNWSSSSVHHAVIKAGLSQEVFYLWIWVFKFDYFLKQSLLVLKLILYTLYNIRVSLGGLVIFWRAIYFILFRIRPKIQSTTKIKVCYQNRPKILKGWGGGWASSKWFSFYFMRCKVFITSL